MTSPQPQVRNRLPDPGAGFVWETLEGAAEPAWVLRPQTAGVRAAYTTRRGGTSAGPTSSLNLSFVAERDVHPGREVDSSVRANRAIAGRAVGAGDRWKNVRQVHGAEVVADEVIVPDGSKRPRADGVWTQSAESTLAVLSADCVLLLVTGRDGIACAHAGWRGLLAGVVENAVSAVGGSAVFAGPAIGPCCFEVSTDVTSAFRDRLGRGVVTDDRHVDLWLAAEEAALRAGADDVRSARMCTACHADLFFSHRRDRGATGRQALLARRDA